MSIKRSVAITGVTGVMGSATLRQMLSHTGHYRLKLLVRPSRRNRRKMRLYRSLPDVEIIWGDLTDPQSIDRLVSDVDMVLHIGGMVSPQADWYPQRTYQVNTQAMRLICEAVAKRSDADRVGVVYIGSVAQYGPYNPPHYWGGVGDRMLPAAHDAYAASKIEAEKILVESGLRKWASLRQTGILYPGLLNKGNDPISFHVPFGGVLEWVTAEDSGRLMDHIALAEPPAEFWCHFYDIGGGASFRLTNYEFEARLLSAIGCACPEKVFEYNWFATDNFHGVWFRDSDRLEQMFHFRSGITADQYFDYMKRNGPFWLPIVPFVPSAIIKKFMKRVANTPGLGTLWWIKNNRLDRIEASFGSLEAWRALPEWKDVKLPVPPARTQVPCKPSHIDMTDPVTWHSVATERGGRLLSDAPASFQYDEPLEWVDADGLKFRATPRHVVEGGYWTYPSPF